MQSHPSNRCRFSQAPCQWGQSLNCSGTEHITRSPLAVMSLTLVPKAVSPQTSNIQPAAVLRVNRKRRSQFPDQQVNNLITFWLFLYFFFFSFFALLFRGPKAPSPASVSWFVVIWVNANVPGTIKHNINIIMCYGCFVLKENSIVPQFGFYFNSFCYHGHKLKEHVID